MPRIKLQETRQLAISVVRAYSDQASTRFQRAQASLSPLSGASFPCIPTNPSSPPARSRGAFLYSSALPRRDRDTNSSESRSESLGNTEAAASSQSAGTGKLFTFISKAPATPPDLVSAQAQQNSPAQLPRSRHPGDRANSDQSASVGRGYPGALL